MAPEKGEGGRCEDLQGDGEEEEEEEEEEVPGRRDPYGSGPSPPQKPSLPSTHSRSSRGSVPFRRKTRDLPNLCNCHGCGLRFPDRGRGERLRPLDSQWRIVLLCKACLRAVRSAQVCSYCFVGLVGGRDGGGFVSCRECACRVHFGCLPEQRGYLAPSDLDPESFTCVDCCAFPISRIRKGSGCGDSSVAGVSDLSLGNSAENGEADNVKTTGGAAEAVAAAKNAADLVRGELDLVSAAKRPMSTAVPDEQFALQLHHADNGSRRISRNLCTMNSDCLIGDKEGLSNVNLLDKKPEPGNCGICGEEELCTEDTLFGTMEIIYAEPLNVIGVSEGNFIVNLGRGPTKYWSEEVTLHRKGDATEVPAKEEQACCSDRFVNSAGDKNSVDGLSVSCPKPCGPNTAMLQQDEKHSMHDRYMIKYRKRPPRMKDR